jgi:predicted metal-dependent hydrolase
VPDTIIQGGRAKAYRPLPDAERRRAFEAGLAAYANDDFFEAHELWEPAWMGTSELAERELIQGLIKLAAAFVHQARGNPRGVEKNLRGARARIAAGAPAGPELGVAVPELLASIDAWLVAPSGGRASGAIAIPRSPDDR